MPLGYSSRSRWMMDADGLPDLHPALESSHLLIAADLPGVELQTVEEGH